MSSFVRKESLSLVEFYPDKWLVRHLMNFEKNQCCGSITGSGKAATCHLFNIGNSAGKMYETTLY